MFMRRLTWRIWKNKGDADMNEFQLLAFARGIGFQIAVAIFLMGMMLRLTEIYSLGRKPNLAEPRLVSGASGWHTLYRRFAPPPGMLQTAYITYIGGYVFHIGFMMVFLLFAQHIKMIQELTGLSWSPLPAPIIDFITVVTLVAMLVVLVDRVRAPVKRFLSGFGDYLAWTITFLPVLTGYLAVKHLFLSYTTLLALHIVSVEIFLVLLPFTKIAHTATVWPSRWFNGNTNGRKGVPV